MTVAEMLDRIDSRELTEWVAYEHMFGPLGSQYADNQLASIEERLVFLTEVTGKRGSKQQPKPPNPVPRPWELNKEPAKRPERRPYWHPPEEDEEEE